MSLIQITAPATTPVSLAEVKRHLNIDSASQDQNLDIYIAAATANLDGRDGWLGRALTEQTWELRLDRFCTEIKIPLPPLKSVTSVKYTDTAGTTQTVTSTDYRVIGGGFGPSIVTPVYGLYWPPHRCEAESVQIQFVCGYGASGVETLPAPIKAALLLMVGAMYEKRESLTTEELLENPTLKALLLPYWIAGF